TPAGAGSELADLVEDDAAAYLGAAVAERPGIEARAAALADLDLAVESSGQADRRRTGGLVLADPVLVGEAARADRALGIVDPGPDAPDVLLPGEVGGLFDGQRVLELEELPRRPQPGPRGDEGPSTVDPHRDLARRWAQDAYRLPLLAQEPGGADARVSGEIELQAGREDPDPAARRIVDEDRLREAELVGDVLPPLLRHLGAVEKHPEWVPELPLSVTEDAQNM